MTTKRPPLRHSWSASDRRAARLIARPLREFLDTEAAGGILLLVATVVALLWANSPFAEGYETLWRSEAGIRIADFELRQDLRHWVNDGLMTIFFFVVGLEIKRELVAGELSDARRAALPAIAAIGGMAVPALLYTTLNAGSDGASGWAIPMATDIAFAVGVLALLGDRCPASLKVFVLSLAIVDDIGAIVVIALFYTEGIHAGWLLTAIVLLVAVIVMRRVRLWWTPLYVFVGVGVWLTTLESGVHATIAGVALGLICPARAVLPHGAGGAVRDAAGIEDRDPSAVHDLTVQARETLSVAERLEHLLHPWTSYVVVPLFALANAGLVLNAETLASAVNSHVTLGIVVGLVAGKTIGITAFSWVATRMRIALLPDGVSWRAVVGVAAVAGIGFTVSLLIAGLAFEDAQLVDEAKAGILCGSLLAGLSGAAILRRLAH